ncbi:MAG: hypothetical protein DSY92_09265 [Planctomycetota bacterium]|nr:MAG: hypothetical protein DSY92_09265 [Planctomycetota bacterium]
MEAKNRTWVPLVLLLLALGFTTFSGRQFNQRMNEDIDTVSENFLEIGADPQLASAILSGLRSVKSNVLAYVGSVEFTLIFVLIVPLFLMVRGAKVKE